MCIISIDVNISLFKVIGGGAYEARRLVPPQNSEPGGMLWNVPPQKFHNINSLTGHSGLVQPNSDYFVVSKNCRKNENWNTDFGFCRSRQCSRL